MVKEKNLGYHRSHRICHPPCVGYLSFSFYYITIIAFCSNNIINVIYNAFIINSNTRSIIRHRSKGNHSDC